MTLWPLARRAPLPGNSFVHAVTGGGRTFTMEDCLRDAWIFCSWVRTLALLGCICYVVGKLGTCSIHA